MCTARLLFSALLLLLSAPLAAVADGIVEAQQLIMRGEYRQAVELLRPMSEQGNSRAQYILGNLSAEGWGVPQNEAEAIKLYEAASRSGDVDAQFNLGLTYYDGRFVKQNFPKAVRWFSLAAAHGDLAPAAQYYLGEIYSNGAGVARNLIAAHMWFNIAAANERDSQVKLQYEQKRDKVANRMSREQIQEAQARATACVQGRYQNC